MNEYHFVGLQKFDIYSNRKCLKYKKRFGYINSKEKE